MSVVLREFEPVLPLAAAVAICEALPVKCAIKWPNDVWHDGRKLAGILVEGRPQEGWAVLGIGLNVSTTDFPQELRDRATSLRLAGSELSSRGGADRADRRSRGMAGGAGRRGAAQRGAAATPYSARPCAGTGGEGTAAGIDESGALLVDRPRRPVKLDAGEVHLRPS